MRPRVCRSLVLFFRFHLFSSHWYTMRIPSLSGCFGSHFVEPEHHREDECCCPDQMCLPCVDEHGDCCCLTDQMRLLCGGDETVAVFLVLMKKAEPVEG